MSAFDGPLHGLRCDCGMLVAGVGPLHAAVADAFRQTHRDHQITEITETVEEL